MTELECEMSREQAKEQIARYEERFAMSSEELLAMVKLGTVPDSFEVMDWRALLWAVARDDGEWTGHEADAELRAIHARAQDAREKPTRAEFRMRYILEEIEGLLQLTKASPAKVLEVVKQRVEWGLRPWSDGEILAKWDDAEISEGVAYKMLGVTRFEARAMLEERIIDRT